MISVASEDTVVLSSVECIRALNRDTGEILDESVWDRAGSRPLLVPIGVRRVQLVLDAEAAEYFTPGMAVLSISVGDTVVVVGVEFITVDVAAVMSGNNIRIKNSGPDDGWVSELRFFLGPELDGAVIELYINGIRPGTGFYSVEEGVVVCDSLWEKISPGETISFRIETRAINLGIEPKKVPAVLLSAKILDSGFHQVYAQGCPLCVNLFAH